jgi:hypothetical protein
MKDLSLITWMGQFRKDETSTVALETSGIDPERLWLAIIEDRGTSNASLSRDDARAIANALLEWAGSEPERWVPEVGTIVLAPAIHEGDRAVVVEPLSEYRQEDELEIIFIEGPDAGRKFFVFPDKVERATPPGPEDTL